MKNSIVKIGDDKILEVNGKRFFPIGARHLPKGSDPNMLKEIGFNSMRWMAFPTETIAPMDLETIKKANIMFYAYIYNRGDFSEDKAKRKKDLQEIIDEVKNCTQMLCYEQQNEPTYNFRSWSKLKGDPEGMKEGSDFIRSRDPNHPIRLGHGLCNLVTTLKKFNASTDIIGCNPYIVKSNEMRINCATRMDGRISDSPNQTLSAVGEYTTKMQRVAEGHPIWMQLQACSNEDWYNAEVYTPELKGHGMYPHDRIFPDYFQMRFMAFNSIVRGATGIEWCMYGLSVDDTHWLEVKKIIRELAELHDIIASPNSEWSPTVNYVELGFSDWDGVEILTKQYKDNPVVIAVNTQFDPMEVVFSGLDEDKWRYVKDYHKNKTFKADHNRFTIFFAPYEVKILFLSKNDK